MKPKIRGRIYFAIGCVIMGGMILYYIPGLLIWLVAVALILGGMHLMFDSKNP